MFQPSQADVRRFFCAAHAKARAGAPMEAIETLASLWIAEHPEYHAELADADAAVLLLGVLDPHDGVGARRHPGARADPGHRPGSEPGRGGMPRPRLGGRRQHDRRLLVVRRLPAPARRLRHRDLQRRIIFAAGFLQHLVAKLHHRLLLKAQ